MGKKSIITLIIARTSIALFLSSVPIVLGLIVGFNGAWYVIPLIALNFIMQFALASFYRHSNFKKLKQLKNK